jgi:hypothetical protein
MIAERLTPDRILPITRNRDYELRRGDRQRAVREMLAGSEEREGHQTFISAFRRRQVLEGRCGCGRSIKSISIECDALGEEQLLQPLFLIQRRVHPQVRGAQ